MKNKYSKYLNELTFECKIEFGNNTLLEMLLDFDKSTANETDYVEIYEEILHRMDAGTGWVKCDCGAGWRPHKHGKSQAGG